MLYYDSIIIFKIQVKMEFFCQKDKIRTKIDRRLLYVKGLNKKQFSLKWTMNSCTSHSPFLINTLYRKKIFTAFPHFLQ